MHVLFFMSRWKLAEPTQFQGEKMYLSLYPSTEKWNYTPTDKKPFYCLSSRLMPPPLTRCYNKQQTILMLFIKLLYFLWLLTDTHFSSELLKVTQHWKSPRDKETTILSLRLSRRELGTKKVLSIPVLDDYYILLWNY